MSVKNSKIENNFEQQLGKKTGVLSLDELVSMLALLGLSTYESKAYVALLTHGSLTSTELSRISGIPQAKLYNVVNKLLAKGLIKVSKTRPLKITIVNPAIALRNLIEVDYARKLQLLNAISRLHSTTPPREYEEERVWITRGMTGIISALEEAIVESMDEVLMATYSDVLSTLLEKSDLREKLKTLSTCLILYDKGGGVIDSLPLFDEVWLKPTRAPVIVISDLRKGVLVPYTYQTRPVAYVIKEPEILLPLVIYYYHLRETSTQVAYRVGVEVTQRTFRSIIRAVDMVKKMREHYEVYASVEGRWVHNKEPGVVKGKIVDYVVDKHREIVSLVLEQEDGPRITVGGQGATVEHFEGIRIKIYGVPRTTRSG